MTVAEEQDQFEKEKAEQIIADTPLMDGIESVTVEFGDDQSGDPAMWLIFHIGKHVNADDHWLKRFNDYSGRLDMRIIHSGVSRFPYTRLKVAA